MNTIEKNRERLRKNADYQRAYRQRNPEKIRAIEMRGYYKKMATETPSEKRARLFDANVRANRRRHLNPDKYHDQWLRRTYGIGIETYYAMLEKQNGRCALCEIEKPAIRSKFFRIDHCHESNRIRGLLCNPCNTALGTIGDTAASLEKALKYVVG